MTDPSGGGAVAAAGKAPLSNTDETTGLDRIRNQYETTPVRTLVGLETLEVELGRVRHRMPVAPWMLDDRGRLAAGALGLMADQNLGATGVTIVGVGMFSVTSGLHLEMAGPMPDDLQHVESEATVLYHDGSTAVVSGLISDGRGRPLATGLLRTIIVRRAESQLRPEGSEARVAAAEAAVAAGSPERPPAASGRGAPVELGDRPQTVRSDLRAALAAPVARALGLDAVSLSLGSGRFHTSAAPHFANSIGGIHGGFGALMGEQAASLTLRSALEPGQYPVVRTIEASYLRAVPAGGQEMAWRADVPYGGRRLMTARAELTDPDGKPAVLVTVAATPT